MRTRSWWGWGWVREALPDRQCRQLAALVPGCATDPLPVPDPAALSLPAPRVRPPGVLASRCSTDTVERAAHTYGKAYRDVMRALHGDLAAAPDLVAYPDSEADVVALLDWAGDAGVAVIPYGGGSSVVGGVEYRGGEDAGEHAGVMSLDLSRLDRVLELDERSGAARVQAGVLGPALEDWLRPAGYTLRHFPQSFEFSTVGGWLATRSAGHFATLHTRIDDAVESMRVVTPAGISESWRLPASGAGPSPDRLFLGSEGALGVITEAWLRVRRRPVHRASATVEFADVGAGLAAVRAIAQSGLYPANCRLLDPGEAMFSGAGPGTHSVLLLGFESPTAPVDSALQAATDLARSLGGLLGRSSSTANPGVGDPSTTANPADQWREAFLRMPYLRDGLARMSAVVETFETACTWDRVPELYEQVRDGVTAALTRICGSPGIVNCRITHVYPDGPAPYFTVIAPGRRGSETAQWDEVKAATAEILHRHGATITHHHAVGRDHRPWYDAQRPDLFAAALRAAKDVLDPRGILNPGVLIS